MWGVKKNIHTCVTSLNDGSFFLISRYVGHNTWLHLPYNVCKMYFLLFAGGFRSIG